MVTSMIWAMAIRGLEVELGVGPAKPPYSSRWYCTVESPASEATRSWLRPRLSRRRRRRMPSPLSSRLRRRFDSIRAALTCPGCVRIHRTSASRGAVSRGVQGHPSSIAIRAKSLRPFNPRPPMTPHRSWLTMPVAMHSACIGHWSQIAIAVRTIARRVATSAAESVPHIMSCIRGSRP